MIPETKVVKETLDKLDKTGIPEILESFVHGIVPVQLCCKLLPPK